MSALRKKEITVSELPVPGFAAPEETANTISVAVPEAHAVEYPTFKGEWLVNNGNIILHFFKPSHNVSWPNEFGKVLNEYFNVPYAMTDFVPEVDDEHGAWSVVLRGVGQDENVLSNVSRMFDEVHGNLTEERVFSEN